MNADPSFAIQAAVYSALTGSADLTALIAGRVYDSVPINAAGQVTATFPYVTIGDDQIVGDQDGVHDTSDAHIQVEAWSRAGGYPEVKKIAGAIRAALSQPLDLTGNGHRVVTGTFLSTMLRREPDGLTRRAIVMFRLITQPNP